LIADGNGIGQSVTSVASQESDINLLDWVQDAESDSDSSIVGEVEAESCSEVEAPTFSENLTEEVCSRGLCPTDLFANQDTDTEDDDINCDGGSSADSVADFLFGMGCVNEETNHGAYNTEESEELLADNDVFPGCPLSVDMSCVLTMTFILHHKLSLKAAQDLIELITSHLPPGHKAVTSLYRLRSYMKKKGGISFDRKAAVCSLCHSLLPKDAESCPNATCQENDVEADDFLVFDVQASLAKLFHDKEFCKDLSQNFKGRDSPVVSDIVTSQNYNRLLENSASSPSKWHITLTLNTDGVSIFKTSRNGTLWPVYMTVNELSPKYRLVNY
jgi:RNA polymerase subunit RPABC4/transcription elongation factor Spt4